MSWSSDGGVDRRGPPVTALEEAGFADEQLADLVHDAASAAATAAVDSGEVRLFLTETLHWSQRAVDATLAELFETNPLVSEEEVLYDLAHEAAADAAATAFNDGPCCCS